MGLRTWLTDLWLGSMCPQYREDMPKTDEPGPWVALAIVVALNGHRSERMIEYVEGGSRQAYRRARDLAMKVDLETPCDAECSVQWALRRPYAGESLYYSLHASGEMIPINPSTGR